MNEHLQMKPVTIYFQEIQYLMYQELARQQGKKAAELIREAMSEYLERKTSCAKKHSDWKPISLGGLKADGDWISRVFWNISMWSRIQNDSIRHSPWNRQLNAAGTGLTMKKSESFTRMTIP